MLRRVVLCTLPLSFSTDIDDDSCADIADVKVRLDPDPVDGLISWFCGWDAGTSFSMALCYGEDWFFYFQFLKCVC